MALKNGTEYQSEIISVKTERDLMALFYHHVGDEGSLENFSKTIFTKINISDIKKYIPTNQVDFQNSIYRHFSTDCPDGTVNCWGVPNGAYYMIEHLKRGDWVLLVEKLDKPFMHLCEVIAYKHEKFRSLSNFLWGKEKYPFIFFLDHEFINKSWSDFCSIIGYSIEYNPMGLFLNVSPEIIIENRGIGNILNKLRK